jgi:hypothetical protein
MEPVEYPVLVRLILEPHLRIDCELPICRHGPRCYSERTSRLMLGRGWEVLIGRFLDRGIMIAAGAD